MSGPQNLRHHGWLASNAFWDTSITPSELVKCSDKTGDVKNNSGYSICNCEDSRLRKSSEALLNVPPFWIGKAFSSIAVPLALTTFDLCD